METGKGGGGTGKFKKLPAELLKKKKKKKKKKNIELNADSIFLVM